MNKIQKITASKRDFFTPKGRQVDDTTIANIKSVLGEEEVNAVKKRLEEEIDWLETHEGESVETVESRKSELESYVNPIMSKLYAEGGSSGPTETPMSEPTSTPSASGPRVEEVD